MTAPNTWKAILRGIMPLLYSVVAAVIAHFGYKASPALVAQIVVLGTGGLTILLHAAERRWPWIGALLGYIGAPQYAPSVKKTLEAQVAQLEAEVAQLRAKPSTP
jgi:hypothetical protein